jgi:hypothetical protein
MKLNKNYFLTVVTALVIQAYFGVNLANAMQCEKEIEQEWANTAAYDDGSKDISYLWTSDRMKSLDEAKGHYYERVKGYTLPSKYRGTVWNDLTNGNYKTCKEFANEMYKGAIHDKREGAICVAKYMSDNDCNNLEVFIYKKGAGQQINSSSSSSSSSNQPSNSGTSSSQTNSPESYNLQVSQNNKQNYQAVKHTYEQANAGKGKKHNKDASATECMKTNPAKQSFTNKCNQPINFTYCFSGVPSGAKNENPQTLAELSCQNGQFATMTIGAGESIPGSYKGLSIGGLPCKSPSQPVDMAFDSGTNKTTGRCSF